MKFLVHESCFFVIVFSDSDIDHILSMFSDDIEQLCCACCQFEKLLCEIERCLSNDDSECVLSLLLEFMTILASH